MGILYRQVRVERSKFLFPSFEEVGQVWIQSILAKQRDLKEVVIRVLESMHVVDDDQVAEVYAQIEAVLDVGRYTDRLQCYAKSLQRSAGRYGLPFEPESYRIDIADALYQTGLRNVIARAKNALRDEVRIHLSSGSKPMGITALMRDKVSIQKKNGQLLSGIAAAVTGDTIVTQGADVLIEPGDLVLRKMSNGGEETFEVIDPGFHEGLDSIPPGYVMRVRKLGLPEAKAAMQNITYNVTGPNARVNHHSVDNSSNTVNYNSEAAELIAALRVEIGRLALPEAEKAGALDVVDAIESQVTSGTPSKAVMKALLDGLPHAASIVTIAQALAAFFFGS